MLQFRSNDLDNLANLKSGNIVLLDTARTDEYNHVFITEYKNIVVDDVIGKLTA